MSKERPKGPKKFWPAWRYSAECPEGKVFATADDVPEGWVDHPSKIGKVEAPAAPTGQTAKKADEPKKEPTKAEAKRAAAEESRQGYLRAAQAKFGVSIVPAGSTVAELIEGLGGQEAADEAVKALNGNGS